MFGTFTSYLYSPAGNISARCHQMLTCSFRMACCCSVTCLVLDVTLPRPSFFHCRILAPDVSVEHVLVPVVTAPLPIFLAVKYEPLLMYKVNMRRELRDAVLSLFYGRFSFCNVSTVV